jgi:hypothetical protein
MAALASLNAAICFMPLLKTIFANRIGLTMDQETDRIAAGTRFKMSKLGAVRCPNLAGKTGTVVELSRYNTGITVLFDGGSRPTCLHRDYIKPLHNTETRHLSR